MLDEVFDSILQECTEETGIQRDHLSMPHLIGGMVDNQRKPDLLFHLGTSLTATQVRATFKAGAPEGWESDRLVAITVTSVFDGTAGDPLQPPERTDLVLTSFDGDESSQIELTPVTLCALHCDLLRRRKARRGNERQGAPL